VNDPVAQCPICHRRDAEPWATGHDVEYRTSEDAFEYQRCAGCGVLFLNPMPVSKLSEIYPANYYSYASENQSIVDKVKDRLDTKLFQRLLRRLSAPKLNVLDVGGGDGWLLTKIRSLDQRVALTQVVDLDRAAEEAARRQGHEYFCGPVETFETENQFDLVLMLNIIEHVADPSAVLSRIRSMLAPGGLILIKTPNTDSLDARLFRHQDWGGYHCPRHWVLFDGASIARVTGEAGLEISRLTYTQGAPFWAVSVLAALARRGTVSISAERPMVMHPLFPVLSAGFAVIDLARSRLGAKTSQMFLELTAMA
jgi:SAM-dependent methyltransferase